MFFHLQMTTEEYGKLGFPGADDLAIMFKFKQMGLDTLDMKLTKELNPNAPTFEQFVVENLDAWK